MGKLASEPMADLKQNQSQTTAIRGAPVPGIGAIAPDFSLCSPLRQEAVRLSDYQGQDVLLVFFRGTWCPNCRKQFSVLTENHERLKAAGIVTIGVICQSEGSVARYLQKNPLPFPLLVDGTRAVAKQYGVHYWISYEGFNLANPALFILDRSRRITFVYRGKNQSDLPLLNILEKFIKLLDSPRSEQTGS